jgi:hypothetical protein
MKLNAGISSLIISWDTGVTNEVDGRFICGLMNLTWTTLRSGTCSIDKQEGPWSPANTSHFNPSSDKDL